MKKLIIVTLVTTCVALCAAVWPRGNAVEETPVASELQPSTGQALAKNSAPEPTPHQSQLRPNLLKNCSPVIKSMWRASAG